MDINQQIAADIERHFPQFIGTNTFEEICRDWVWLASNQGLFTVPEESGNTWTKEAQVDIVGINRPDRVVVLGEAKWTKTKEKLSVLQKLVDSIDLVIPSQGNWDIHLVGFAKRGWSREAERYAHGIDNQGLKGRRWKVLSFRLRNLQELEAEFGKWAN